MCWLVFDVDGVLIDVSDSFDIAVKKTVETILERFDKAIDLNLKFIRDLREKGIFSTDFDVSKALILGKLDYGNIENFVDQFPERETKAWIEDSTDVFIEDESVKQIFNSYYFGNKYQNSSIEYEPIYKREKKIIDLNLIKEIKKNYNIGIITGRDRKEMELAEEIIGFSFEDVITRDDFKKPDPTCLERILDSNKGIYIGDTETDRVMVEKFNKLHGNSVKFYKVMENRDVNKILKEIIKEKKSSGKA